MKATGGIGEGAWGAARSILLGLALLALPLRAATRVGILLFGEATSYFDSARGVTDALREAGFREPETTFVVERAGSNKAAASEIAHRFAREGFSLVVALGTSAAVAAAREMSETPVVFARVYDPVDAGIVRSLASSGNNTTGMSARVPMERVVEALLLARPVRRLAVLYTPRERNSASQLRDLLAVQASTGIKVVPVPVASDEEIRIVLPRLLKTVDAIYVTGSNVVGQSVSAIVEAGIRGNVVTVTHLEEMVARGVLLGVAGDGYDEGRLAGARAVRVLRGESPSSVPIGQPTRFDLLLNIATAGKGDFRLPAPFLAAVTRKLP